MVVEQNKWPFLVVQGRPMNWQMLLLGNAIKWIELVNLLEIAFTCSTHKAPRMDLQQHLLQSP